MTKMRLQFPLQDESFIVHQECIDAMRTENFSAKQTTIFLFPWMAAILIMLILTILGTVKGQATVSYGDHFPPNADSLSWFLDTLEGTAWHFEDGKWANRVLPGTTKIDACLGVVFISNKKSPRASLQFEEGTGKQLNWVRGYRCVDDVRLQWEDFEKYIFIAVSQDGDTLTYLNLRCKDFWPDTIPQILSTGVGFSAPRWQESYPLRSCDGLHTWGFLGSNGQWLIEPKFDGRFRFENGVADVVYYGQKRKINEKGEFVE